MKDSIHEIADLISLLCFEANKKEHCMYQGFDDEHTYCCFISPRKEFNNCCKYQDTNLYRFDCDGKQRVLYGCHKKKEVD